MRAFVAWLRIGNKRTVKVSGEAIEMNYDIYLSNLLSVWSNGHAP